MATLTEAAEQARKAIKFGAIGFVGITIAWYLGIAGIELYKRAFPAPPPPPTMDFGKLPAMNFPVNSERPKVSLELPTGAIPAFPDRMRVYKAPTKRSGFADPDRATDVATQLGFLFKPEAVTESQYVWTVQDQLNSKLDMNIISGHFTLTRTWQNNPSLVNMANFTSEKGVIQDVESYLRKAGVLQDDAVGVEKITFLKDDGGKLVNALSLSDSDFIQVDLFRKDIEEIDPNSKTKEVVAKYPFWRTDPTRGLFRVIVSGSRNFNERYIYIDNDYTQVEYEVSGTYPIKTGEQAWAELQSGGGFVTSSGPTTGEVKIRQIFLGYYDSDSSQSYAMPIYIFKGDQNFVAYVSAVNESLIAK